MNASGGLPPYRYVFTDSIGIVLQDTEQNYLADLEGGRYDVTVFDANNCEINFLNIVVEDTSIDCDPCLDGSNRPPSYISNYQDGQMLPCGMSLQDVLLDIDIIISDPDGNILSQSNPDLEIDGNTLSIAMYAIDLCGEILNDTIRIQESDELQGLDIVQSNMNCESVRLSTLNPQGYEIEWYNVNTLVDDGDMLTVDQPGSYTVVYTDDNGCTGTQDVTVVIDQFDIAITPQNVMCQDTPGSVDIELLNGDVVDVYVDEDYVTSLTSTGTINLPAGTYDIRATNENGCSESVTITIQDEFVATASETQDHITQIMNNQSVVTQQDFWSVDASRLCDDAFVTATATYTVGEGEDAYIDTLQIVLNKSNDFKVSNIAGTKDAAIRIYNIDVHDCGCIYALDDVVLVCRNSFNVYNIENGIGIRIRDFFKENTVETVRLVNMSGQNAITPFDVIITDGEVDFTIDTSGLPAGAYGLFVGAANQIVTVFN